MLPHHSPHWETFLRIPHREQENVGAVPARWAEKLPDVPDRDALPEFLLDRSAVARICRDRTRDVLFGYVCAMAWGGQSDQSGYKSEAWNRRDALRPKLERLREGGLNHAQVWDLFSGANRIECLGPSFFTKLIYFFSPEPVAASTGFYIMDQWTAKSVNLLTQQPVVRLARIRRTSPGFQNKCGNYQAFCEEVDAMGRLLGCTGAIIEERLFSRGGSDPWDWRKHVDAHWPRNAPTSRYRSAVLQARYPHIPLRHF